MAGSLDGTVGSDPEHQDLPHRWLGFSRLALIRGTIKRLSLLKAACIAVRERQCLHFSQARMLRIVALATPPLGQQLQMPSATVGCNHFA
jgi:hypothetical protein